MAGRLIPVVSRIMGAKGQRCCFLFCCILSPPAFGPGTPRWRTHCSHKPLLVNVELVWDNGTPFPEPCICRIADTVGEYEALAWMCGRLGLFASLELLAVWNDKAPEIRFAPKGLPLQQLKTGAWWRTLGC